MIGRLILWLCIIWLPLVMYFVLRNEAKFKKNIAVGVTLPYEGRTDPETVRLLALFKKRVGLFCLLLAALAVVGMLLPVSFGLSLSLFLVWVDLCIVLPYLPYVACHRGLKQLKQARGWMRPSEGITTAELAVAAQPLEDLRAVHFVLPLFLSLVPVVWEALRGQWVLSLCLLIDTLMVVLLYAVYRWCYRRRAETVDENPDRTNALTRLRRRYWLRGWILCGWFMGLLSLGIWLTVYLPVPGFALTCALSLALLIAVMVLEFRLRRAQERLTAESGRACYVDSDDKWIWGMFYYDRNDRHLMVNARTGGNTTVNLARPAGKVVLGLTAVLLAFMPLMGASVAAEEKTSVVLEVTDTHLVASHGRTEYEIPLDGIRSVELLEQAPSGLVRTVGTSLPNVNKGKFSGGGYGTVTLCMDPRTGPWLLVTGEGTARWLVGGTENTEAVYECLISGIAP